MTKIDDLGGPFLHFLFSTVVPVNILISRCRWMLRDVVRVFGSCIWFYFIDPPRFRERKLFPSAYASVLLPLDGAAAATAFCRRPCPSPRIALAGGRNAALELVSGTRSTTFPLPFPTDPLTSPLFLSVRRSSLPPHDGDMPTERLTDDLLLEIISRVPSRQRWLCKRVCRRWLRLARTLPQFLAPALPWPASSTPPPARSASRRLPCTSSTSQVTGAAR